MHVWTIIQQNNAPHTITYLCLSSVQHYMLLFFDSSLFFLFVFFNACVYTLFWLNYASNITKLLNSQCVIAQRTMHTTPYEHRACDGLPMAVMTPSQQYTQLALTSQKVIAIESMSQYFGHDETMNIVHVTLTWQQHTETSKQTHALYIQSIYTLVV